MATTRQNCCIINDPLNKIKSLVIQYTHERLTEFFANASLTDSFELIYKNGLIDDSFDEFDDLFEDEYQTKFIETTFNSDDACACGYKHNFYTQTEGRKLNTEFNVSGFIYLWSCVFKWFKDTFNTVIEMKNDEESWNTIAFWVISEYLYDHFFKIFKELYKESYVEYVDTVKRKSRITCGVCYEDTILYTGCRVCNNNYLCKKCYYSLEDDNQCPFCRTNTMMLDDYCDRERDLWRVDGGQVWLDKIQCVNESIIDNILRK